jgi:hypothetical protein
MGKTHPCVVFRLKKMKKNINVLSSGLSKWGKKTYMCLRKWKKTIYVLSSDLSKWNKTIRVLSSSFSK